MNEPEVREAPLAPDDVASVLRLCSPEGVLVGGQALALWVDWLGVPVPPALTAGITTDVDFIGNAQLAKRLGRGLGWKTWIPSLDDVTIQIAKVTKTGPDGWVKQVDFLSGIVGLPTRAILKRVAQLEVDGVGTVTLLHPADVLESRVANLRFIPGKRTPAGLAQCRLAIEMVAAYIRREIRTHGVRAGLKLLERVVDIAEDYPGLVVYVLYGIDVLGAVPLDAFDDARELHDKRWPQVQAELGRQRAALAKLAGRVSEGPQAEDSTAKRPRVERDARPRRPGVAAKPRRARSRGKT